MLALLVALSLASGPIYPTADCTGDAPYAPDTDAGTPYAYAAFEFAPPTGLGMPSASCTDAGVFAVIDGGQALVAVAFSRASVAECSSNDGQTITQVESNVPVVSSGRTDETQLGVWVQPTRANYATHPRDLSQAVWVKTSMTCTKTATGMRNDANGASTCTASSSNSTVLQPIVLASGPRAFSVRIKRRAGTGTVNVTANGGTNWYATTLGSGWTWVTPTQTPGCAPTCNAASASLAGTMTNPSVGIQLAVSGDAVDVDFVQLEDGAYATLPIESGPTAAVRQTETMTAAMASISSIVDAGCAAGTLIPQDPGAGAAYHFLAVTATNGWELYSSSANNTSRSYDGTNEPSVAYTPTPGTGNRFVSSWRSSTLVTQNQTAGAQTSGAFDGTMGIGYGVVAIGGTTTGANPAAGIVKGLMFDPSPGKCLDRVVDWLGDSIVANCGGACTSAQVPSAQLGASLHRVVVNAGVGGDTTAQCATRWTSTYKPGLSRSLVWSCGVNDVANSISGATAAANAQAVVTEAVALGRRVIVTGIMPWANSAGWTSGKDAEGLAYNAAMSAWCPANGCTYVSTDSLGTGTPLVLSAGYDSGDHIHENPAGAAAFSALVAGANP